MKNTIRVIGRRTDRKPKKRLKGNSMANVRAGFKAFCKANGIGVVKINKTAIRYDLA